MKSLPKNPDLGFLKKQAKALRASHRLGEASCCDTLRQHDTAFRSLSNAEILSAKFSINDAQRIIAREYDYSSWASLKHYIASLNSPLYHGVSDQAAYHQGIIDSYDQRSAVYDNHVWAREWSQQTVDFMPPKRGENILDLACGSGTIAFYIADKVGADGFVTGVDISQGMINRCHEKLKQSGLRHLKFDVGDAENLSFPVNTFDRIYCSGGLYWMINPLAALRHWNEILKPGGWLGFSAWPSNSFVWGDGLRQVMRNYGVNLTVHEFSGDQERTRQLVTLAGFENIKLHEVQRGRWMKPEDLKGEIKPGDYTPGQYPDPLAGVSEAILKRAQKDLEAAVDKLTTEKGVWHDMTTYFVYCQKPRY